MLLLMYYWILSVGKPQKDGGGEEGDLKMASKYKVEHFIYLLQLSCSISFVLKTEMK